MRVSLPQHQHQNLFNIHYATLYLFIYLFLFIGTSDEACVQHFSVITLCHYKNSLGGLRYLLIITQLSTRYSLSAPSTFCCYSAVPSLISPRHHHQFIFELYFTLCTRNNKTTFSFSGGGRRDNASLIFQADYRKNTQPEVGASYTQEQQ